jgi:hypothetical protein
VDQAAAAYTKPNFPGRLVVKAVILVLLSIIGVTSCSGGRGAAFVFYVVIKPDEPEKFIGAVTAIAKQEGLQTAAGESVSDTGSVLRAVEGRRCEGGSYQRRISHVASQAIANRPGN